MAQKFYVVWRGRKTGIFSDWPSTHALVDGFAGARYKSFATRAEADAAWRAGAPATTPRRTSKKSTVDVADSAREIDQERCEFDVQIFCDGACDPNPGHAGSGIAIYREGKLAELWYGLHNPNGTNNTAELNALHRALQFAAAEIDEGRSVQVLSDSKYAINCVSQWAAGWEKKGWRRPGGEIKNLEIIQTAYALYTLIAADLSLTHVAAHVGTEGNELADRMAMHAVLTREKELRRFDGDIDVAKILRMRTG